MTTPRQLFHDATSGIANIGNSILDVNLEQMFEAIVVMAFAFGILAALAFTLRWIFRTITRFLTSETLLYKLGRAVRAVVKYVSRR